MAEIGIYRGPHVCRRCARAFNEKLSNREASVLVYRLQRCPMSNSAALPEGLTRGLRKAAKSGLCRGRCRQGPNCRAVQRAGKRRIRPNPNGCFVLRRGTSLGLCWNHPRQPYPVSGHELSDHSPSSWQRSGLSPRCTGRPDVRLFADGLIQSRFWREWPIGPSFGPVHWAWRSPPEASGLPCARGGPTEAGAPKAAPCCEPSRPPVEIHGLQQPRHEITKKRHGPVEMMALDVNSR